MCGWYAEHHLPPGMWESDHLPPGLERQLVVRATLPPALRAHVFPCPQDLEHRLTPPPPDCAHVLIGGHIVLLNRANFQVGDVLNIQL